MREEGEDILAQSVDQVLGIQSHDMDVAIDTMMGFDFAQHVHDYICEERKEPQLLGHGGKIAKIASNPEKSKHLETATIQLCGLEVDFVNLRNEAYTEGSRIPTVVRQGGISQRGISQGDHGDQGGWPS